jgi:hypothetical protein
VRVWMRKGWRDVVLRQWPVVCPTVYRHAVCECDSDGGAFKL